MFRIAVFVGKRVPGGWFAGLTRYPTAEAASREIADIQRAELRCDCTKMLRRVVPA